MKHLSVVEEYANTANSDISSHLPTIYKAVFEFKPQVIVELGVRGGESSRVFSYINEELGSRITGVDIDSCPYEEKIVNSTFIKADDCLYAKQYQTLHGANIDVLMIDTSHMYEHTVQEIEAWFPLLKPTALAIFHDTNLGLTYVRHNGTTGTGWDNNRGVIRALEKYFNQLFNEKQDFSFTVTKNNQKWKIDHIALCNGLTICYKL